ncbi:right-handed parallel beta-helix repeat-containing protein [Pinibacter aurantiacus]|uniref:Right-handed parallel beta-helix repeat-containing protein n=1 Tax=Pinibacter aurantiacus TaxID=2851599 RepID=A0A9E2W8K1_9BACT|nr:right-handed parallel beta-helix repeat-containing protein [Pinibacter aurantiacus]MBV4358651.1 right-handed parallel beta-helix repeat-containing protein [Pinibacter aurantiacus]
MKSNKSTISIQKDFSKMWKPVSAAVLAGAMFFTSCSKDDNGGGTNNPPKKDSTSVSGTVSGTWKKNSVVIVKGHLEIPSGSSLTIEEGVQVLMSDSTIKPEFIIKGNLYSIGTATNPVKISVPDAWKTTANAWGALWGGLTAGASCAEIVLNYTDLSYGGAVTTESSPSVKGGLYKAAAGEHVPALYFPNINGKLVVTNSTIHNFNEDALYIEGGSVIIDNNKFYTTGIENGEAVNLKSGVIADVAYNLIYSPNTNGMKLSNSGDRTPQLYIVGYNNTIVNAGWRRPTTKGGSIWVEKSAHVDIYNNLLVNDRYGVKRDKGNPEDSRSKFFNTYYYSYTQTGADQFQPTAEIIAGTGDVISAKAGDNDPKFVNYPLSNDNANGIFDTNWDFHLQSGSNALGKGKQILQEILQMVLLPAALLTNQQIRQHT